MDVSGNDIRKGIEANWHEYLSKYGNLFSSDQIQGSSPPSVFVGSYGYPKVGVGPMLPPVFGDTRITSIDSQSPPFGPIGEIKTAKFSPRTSNKTIENVFYDNDLNADSAVIKLYNSGIDISTIQKCFSIGMVGKDRRLVPTKWSITATDDIISKNLMQEILDYNIIDSFDVFSFN